ncbi:MAG: type III secretion protein [Lachnospiraceae bacterium]|nr:type III secretion protein [Lachnospiraceae bacterium]
MSRFNDLLNKKAVALKYDERQSAAPIVVASGMGYVAEKMVEVANESGVPVYEDNSLATVLSQLNLGTEIPEELYKAVVDIYAYFLRFVPGSVEQTREQTEDVEDETGASQDGQSEADVQTEETSTEVVQAASGTGESV